jgi:hypothetical protein
MAVIYEAKILLKTGSGYPGIVLDYGEAGYDGSANKFWIGNGVGNPPTGITMDPSYNYLYNLVQSISSSTGNYTTFAYVDGSLLARDISIDWLNQNKANLMDLYPFATNVSVGLALNPYATNASVGLAIAPFATNASVGLALNPYATNASVGLALQPYATNASIGLALAPYATNSSVNAAFVTTNASFGAYATNASVGLALQPYATNASVNIYATKTDASIIALQNADKTFATNASVGLAIAPFATNSSVGLALGPYATNASTNSAFGLRDTSIAFLNSYRVIQDASIAAINASTGGIYGSQFKLDSSLSLSTTTSQTPVVKVLMTTPSLPAGTYKITCFWIYNRSTTGSTALFDVSINGTLIGTTPTLIMRSQNPADFYPVVKIFYLALSGVNNIALEYYGNTGATTSISDATIELIRVQ